MSLTTLFSLSLLCMVFVHMFSKAIATSAVSSSPTGQPSSAPTAPTGQPSSVPTGAPTRDPGITEAEMTMLDHFGSYSNLNYTDPASNFHYWDFEKTVNGFGGAGNAFYIFDPCVQSWFGISCSSVGPGK
jgi:hypothetical protein